MGPPEDPSASARAERLELGRYCSCCCLQSRVRLLNETQVRGLRELLFITTGTRMGTTCQSGMAPALEC